MQLVADKAYFGLTIALAVSVGHSWTGTSRSGRTTKFTRRARRTSIAMIGVPARSGGTPN